MNREIKLVDGPINQSLHQLNTSINGLKTHFPKYDQGENVLKMVESLTEINKTIETVLLSYQTILLNHVELTKEAIVSLKQTDENIASSIQLLK